jgi:hypothetical protein
MKAAEDHAVSETENSDMPLQFLHNDTVKSKKVKLSL